MSNSTSSLPQVFIDVSWTVQGAVIGGCNFVLVAAILKYRALRDTKQYLILAGLALADGINMMNNFTGGLYRLFFLPDRQVTARWCLLVPHFTIMLFSDLLATSMLCVVAFDRLLFMLWPLPYLAKPVSYAKKLLAATYIPILAYSSIGFAKAFVANGPDNLLDHRCMAMQFFGNFELVGQLHSVFYRLSSACTATLSVVLFLTLWPIYIWRQNKVGATVNQSVQLKRQKAFTKSIAISTCCTLFLFLMPYASAMYAHSQNWVSVMMASKFLFGLNPLANVYIYQMRHKETRQAVKGLFSCKLMPDNLDLWHSVSTGSNRKAQIRPKNG